jgi:MFS transporter, Spinster family, sphingosine-1-phosphate transporter
MPRRQYPLLALILLTALNLFNYIDRYVVFAVQPLIQQEFHRDDFAMGFLTTSFFWCYMIVAPFVGMAADRYTRKWIIIGGAIVWSAATLLTWVTHDYWTLVIRHLIVGVGEASFGTVAPGFLADLYSEERRGRVMGILYMAQPVGSALGYVIGGYLGSHYGWRIPFLVVALPGFLLAMALLFIPEPARGSSDKLRETPERATIVGLFHNRAFWTATLGMAMVTFALGGMSVWMPTFLSRMRGVPLARSGVIFGGIIAISGIFGTLTGGWIGDRLLRRTPAAHYIVSAGTLLIAVPAMVLAIFNSGRYMFPAMFVAAFLLFMNTGPLNAAIVTSVGAHIRATAFAINIFVIHLLGDAFSAQLMGYISVRSSLQYAFIAAFVAIFAASMILFYGRRYAPVIPTGEQVTAF